MNTVTRWLVRPWTRIRRAKDELAKSRADQPAVAQLGRDLQRIDRENHVTARIHRAARGGAG